MGLSRLKYHGDDLVLISDVEDSKMLEMLKEEEDDILYLFHCVKKWSPKLQLGYRLIWLKCKGLPLHAWDLESCGSLWNTGNYR